MRNPPRRPNQGRPTSYLASAGKLRTLTREEEHRLALRAQRGDRVARDRLTQHGLPVVLALVRRLRLGTVRLEDVIQEGNLGLLRALETFDPHAGTRLSTYAVWWIRAYVGKYLREARSIVRRRGGEPSLSDQSLDVAVGQEDDTTHLDRVKDERPSPEDALLSEEVVRGVRDTLDRHRDRIGRIGIDVVYSRLELDEPDTLEEVAARWGLSRERVRQIELQTKRLLAALIDDDRGEAA